MIIVSKKKYDNDIADKNAEIQGLKNKITKADNERKILDGQISDLNKKLISSEYNLTQSKETNKGLKANIEALNAAIKKLQTNAKISKSLSAKHAKDKKRFIDNLIKEKRELLKK